MCTSLARSDLLSTPPEWVSAGKLYKADKRQDNQDDHNCPNDVNDIVHGASSGSERDFDTKVSNTNDTSTGNSVPQTKFRYGVITPMFLCDIKNLFWSPDVY